MNMVKPKAICFHGFLGSTADFATLSESFEVFNLNLKPTYLSNEKSYESWEQLIGRIKTEFENYVKSLDKEDNIYIFSYSMGSKVLFALFEDIMKSEILENFLIRPKIVLISTHFGLYQTELEQEQELAARQQMKIKFLNLLEDNSLSLFLNAWSNLDLFSKDRVSPTDWSLDQIKHYFKNWSQSQSKNRVNLLTSNFNFLIFHGALDIKYKEQSDRLKAFNLSNVCHFELAARSHRLLQVEDLNFIARKSIREF